MKKYLFGILALSLMSALPALASKKIATCTNGEETTVVLVEVSPGNYKANVTMQSFGDSYPVYHFTNLKLEPVPPFRLGAPQIYVGKGFELSIQFNVQKAPALLIAPSIGLDNEPLTCR